MASTVMYKLLGINNIDQLADDVISGATVTFRGSSPYYGYSSERIMYTVMREKLDLRLM